MLPVGRETGTRPRPFRASAREVTYLHTQGTVGIDWRTSPGYTRRGGFYGATLHDYNDRDDDFGFQMVEYEGDQHVPILREAWVLSFHGRVQTALEKDGQQTPFFMLPALGGGSTLRGYSSWRFRDQNSLLLQAEWRIMVNRYLDLAFFYDAGKVAARTSDLDFDGLKDDFGVGVRFHGPFATPLRIELAKSREAVRLHLLVVRRLLGHAPCAYQHVSSRARRVAIPGSFGRRGRPLRHRRLDAGPALLSGRSDRARARIAGRLEGGALRPVADVRAGLQPVRQLRLQAERPAREEHQHDRRGAGLELVHQPHRHQADHDRRARSRPERRRAARPVEVGADQGEDVGRASRASRRWTPRARPGSSSSIRRTSRKAPPRPSRSRPRFSGRWATTRWNRS